MDHTEMDQVSNMDQVSEMDQVSDNHINENLIPRPDHSLDVKPDDAKASPSQIVRPAVSVNDLVVRSFLLGTWLVLFITAALTIPFKIDDYPDLKSSKLLEPVCATMGWATLINLRTWLTLWSTMTSHNLEELIFICDSLFMVVGLVCSMCFFVVWYPQYLHYAKGIPAFHVILMEVTFSMYVVFIIMILLILSVLVNKLR